MGRGKLKLDLIANERARKTTFQKRKKGIMKKAYELSVLCDVDVCLIVSGPKLDKDDEFPDCDGSGACETFPPDRDGVLKVVNKYGAALRGNSQKKAYTLSDIVAERKRRVDEEIARCGTGLLEGLSAEELRQFMVKLDDKIDSIRIAIEAKKEVLSSPSCYDHDTDYVDPASGTWGMVSEDRIAPGVMMLGRGAGASSLCYGAQHAPYFYPLPLFGMQPVPDMMQYPVNMSANLDPRIGHISPVIRTACEGNSELCSVVNSIMRNVDKRA